MPGYRLRSVNPGGLVLNECGFEAADLDEALARAHRFAASLMAAAPEGKCWDGWCVDLLDGCGRVLGSMPVRAARRERPGRSERDLLARLAGRDGS